MPNILIAAPVKEHKEVFEKYLAAINRLIVPDNCTLYKFFLLHDCDELGELLNSVEYEYIHSNDNSKKHCWSDAKLALMSAMRNMIIEHALYYDFDYVFSVDSDIILHRQTLNCLINANKDIVSEVFWTQWPGFKTLQPNAWDYDAYTINDINAWTKPGLYRVGMTGACTLINTKVFKAGVNYTPINNVSMSKWEDKAFCIRAACAGFEIWLDTHYPAEHLYE